MTDYLKDLRKANDDYHDAIEAVISNDVLDTDSKAKLGSIAHSIFTLMTELDTLVASFYDEE